MVHSGGRRVGPAAGLLAMVVGAVAAGVVTVSGPQEGAWFSPRPPSPVETGPREPAESGTPSRSPITSTPVEPSTSAPSSAEESEPEPEPTTTTTTTDEPAPSPSDPPPPPPPPTAEPPPAPDPPAPPTETAAVVDLVNRARTEAGCDALRFDDRLSRAAQSHSTDMANRDYFSHESPEGTTFVDRANAAGHPSPAAENIAMGARDADQVMRMWLDSPGHRDNILNCDLTTIGVGLDTDGWYWTQVFGR